MIKCAIIGLGRIGSSLEDDTLREKPASHAGAIDAHPHCVLIAGADIDPDKTRAFSSRWGCKKIYSDYREMILNETPDILHIATPPEVHGEMVSYAVQKKVPVIICEKPLAHNLKAAREMTEVIRQSGSRVLVNHERRYALPYKHTREVIEQQKYGQLLSITGKLFMGRKRKVSDMLWDDGTHMIDVFHFLTGTETEIVSVMGDTSSAQSTFVATLRAGDIAVLLEIGPGRDHIVFELDLSFEHGRIRAGNGLYEEYLSDASPYYEKMRSLRLRREVAFEKTEYFIGIMKDAVRVFQCASVVPLSSAADGLLAVEVMDRLLRFNTQKMD